MTTTRTLRRRFISHLCFTAAAFSLIGWVLHTCSPYEEVEIGPEPGGER